MQASLSGKQGRMRALRRSLHLESGVVGKSRLPAHHDYPAVCDDSVLAFLFSRNLYQITDN